MDNIKKEFIFVLSDKALFKVPILENAKVNDIKIFVDKYLTDNNFNNKNYNIYVYTDRKNGFKIEKNTINLGLKDIWNNITQGYIVVKKITPHIRVGGTKRATSYPTRSGYVQIPAWSRGAGKWKQLSPFYLGPVIFKDLNENGEMVEMKAVIFENFWQSNKVWDTVDKQKQKNGWVWPKEVHIGEDGLPNKAWYKWRDSLRDFGKAVRRPNGRKVPLYAYFQGKKLDVIEARKEIYIPYYQELLRNNPVYLDLLERVRKGGKVIIIEPDGPDPSLYPEGKAVDLDTVNKWIEVTRKEDVDEGVGYRAYGHGYVIAKTLLEDLSS